MKEIAAAFVRAQKAFGPALKTNTNPHFRSKYADLSACVEAVIDALNANGIGLMQQTHESDSGVIVETCFIHESGEMLTSGKLHVPASKNDPQGYGSALTYARRYSLMAACGIAPEDDDGNAASKKDKIQYITAEQVANIDALITETGADKKAILAWVSSKAGEQVTALKNVPADAYEPIIKQLENKRSKA